MSRLEVRLFDRRCGEVAIGDGGLRAPEDWSFRYDTQYLQSNEAPVALSVSLPLRAQAHEGAVARNWFCNLLPEGSIRDAVVQRLRIAGNDDFALLGAIGGECAGAVSVGASVAPAPQDEDGDLETLLYLAGDGAAEGTWAMLGIPHRLSLAGAQDKIAVVEDAGRLRLPATGEISTHILKPDSIVYPGLRDLEALGLRLARAIGLNVAQSALTEVAGRPALLLERYDRASAPDGRMIRLHQEDFCQALGYPAELKYEQQGGPGLAQCAQLVRAPRLSLGPAAVQGLLEWVIYCTIIGNADAHAKNLALLCDPLGRRSLAPFYDLVPTIAFHERNVDRTPALRIGHAARIDAVDEQDWRAFAAEAGYAPRYVLDAVRGSATAVLHALPGVVAQLVAEGANARFIRDRAAPAIVANAERLRDLPGAAQHRRPVAP